MDTGIATPMAWFRKDPRLSTASSLARLEQRRDDMNDVLPMLIGAALVSTGVLASALADRIRGLRASTPARREAREPREVPALRESMEPVARVESRAKGLTTDGWKPVGTPAHGVVATVVATGSDDIIAALVGSGYKKALATKAVAACTAQEQASPGIWIAAALRRCAMGGAS